MIRLDAGQSMPRAMVGSAVFGRRKPASRRRRRRPAALGALLILCSPLLLLATCGPPAEPNLRFAYPGRPLYLLGESMGGAVAILAATGAMQGVASGPDGMPVAEADGVILSAPAVWGRATMALMPKLALFAAVRLFPDTAMSG